MKKSILLFFFFLPLISLFAQEENVDLLDIFPAIIDKGSIKQTNEKISLRIHKADSKELETNPLAVIPDREYTSGVAKQLQTRLVVRLQALKGDFEKEIHQFVESHPDPQDIDETAVSDFLIKKFEPVIFDILENDFNLSHPMALSLYKSVLLEKFSPKPTGRQLSDLSYTIEIDCKKQTMEYKSVIFKYSDGTLEELQLKNEKRDIKNSDPRGMIYRLSEIIERVFPFSLEARDGSDKRNANNFNYAQQQNK
ncbi:hypothetical protein [Prevotella sp. 10(H)]|uniref:hypothetical protein n=1 Tax=Prevotella sp. 10(H) TaxID=1158294 RepID=UPI000A4A582F|nr:hypothetical protein [Prevotella sp. 10(H)]